MGDRCHVSLYVLTEQADAAQALFQEEADEGPCEEGELTQWEFEEVNYGELEFLSKLKAAGITYHTCAAGGDDYGPFDSYLRFTAEGEAIEWGLSEGEGNSIAIKLLRTVLDKPETTLDDVRTYLDKHVADLTPLPWDNQVQYGRIYRTRQLIEQ